MLEDDLHVHSIMRDQEFYTPGVMYNILMSYVQS